VLVFEVELMSVGAPEKKDEKKEQK